MAALVGVSLLLARRRFPWRLALGFAVPVVPWLVFAELYFGSILPTPLAAKRGFSEAPEYLHRVFFEHKAAFKRLIALYAPGEFLRAGLSYLYLVPVLAGAVAAVLRDRRWAVLGVYPFLHVGVYAAIGADPGFTWHYYVASPVLYLFFAAGACEILRLAARPLAARLRRWPRWAPAAITAIALVPLLLHTTRQMRHRYRLDPHTAQLFEIGGWLRDHYPEDTSLLQPAIGILGWVTGFRMIDHAGLVTPGLYFFHDRRATPVDEVLARFEPDLVLVAAASPADPGASGYRRVRDFEGPWSFTLYERRGITAESRPEIREPP